MNLEKYAKPSEMDIEDIMDFISDVQNDHEGLISSWPSSRNGLVSSIK